MPPKTIWIIYLLVDGSIRQLKLPNRPICRGEEIVLCMKTTFYLRTDTTQITSVIFLETKFHSFIVSQFKVRWSDGVRLLFLMPTGILTAVISSLRCFPAARYIATRWAATPRAHRGCHVVAVVVVNFHARQLVGKKSRRWRRTQRRPGFCHRPTDY